MKKLNLGCGMNHKAGFINVDKEPHCKPDVLHDLEVFPWPWEDNSIDYIRLCHVLEHLGERLADYFKIWQEMYRVCHSGAIIDILVPHPRHDSFLNDPTHIRPITVAGLEMFSMRKNQEYEEKGFRDSQLARAIGVDFEVTSHDYHFEPGVPKDEAEVMGAMYRLNNICYEIAITMVCKK